MLGKAPDLCDVPPASFLRRKDTQPKLCNQRVACPAHFGVTSRYHFIGATVDPADTHHVDEILQKLQMYAETVAPVKVAHDYVVDLNEL